MQADRYFHQPPQHRRLRRAFCWPLAVLFAAPLCMPSVASATPLWLHGFRAQQPDNSSQTAQSPTDRARQYMKFIDQRMNEIRPIITSQHTPTETAQLRAKLEEVTHLCYNLQDTLQTADQQHIDLRKPLKDLIAASARWSDVMGAIVPDGSSDFSRKMAIQSVHNTHDLAVKLSAGEEQYFASHK